MEFYSSDDDAIFKMLLEENSDDEAAGDSRSKFKKLRKRSHASYAAPRGPKDKKPDNPHEVNKWLLLLNNPETENPNSRKGNLKKKLYKFIYI